jgi:voltage-gated potassium channel
MTSTQKPDSPGEKPGQTAAQRITFGTRLNELTKKPHRHPAIHWAALIISILSLIPLILWVAKPSQILSDNLAANWYWLDIIFSVFFAGEFVTRSGFRWNPSRYTRTHFFDFIAIVPALVLVHLNVPYYSVWVWIILIFRIVRALDRILGDGFIPRNALALAEGFEEEISDRVMIRILDRIQADFDRGKFPEAIGKVFESHKEQVLSEIRAQHPRLLESGLAHAVGINKALEKAEEQVYEALVKILKSPEVDKTVRDSVDSTFSTFRKGIAEKSWKKNLGFKQNPPG